jgi:hypothetical protein
MKPAVESIQPSRAIGHRRRTRGLEDRLVARMLAPWLDRELADGAEVPLSNAHAARAEQLISPHTRTAVARSLEKLLERAQTPKRAAPIATIPLCREQVVGAAPLIASTVSRLRSGERVDARAVARLKLLIGDRRGPFYRLTRFDALAVALREISDAS